MITKTLLENALTYNEYFNLVEKLAKEGGTTGDEQSEGLINYTKLNYSRMKRVYKTTKPSVDVVSTVDCLSDKLTWLIISESWCGDAAQNIPVFKKITEINPNIELKIILRDLNPALMNQFLTNGAKSIPKLICIDSDNKVLGTWGPRPQYLQQWLYKEKQNSTMPMAELKELFQRWYIKDKGQTLQNEMVLLLSKWLNKECISI